SASTSSSGLAAALIAGRSSGRGGVGSSSTAPAPSGTPVSVVVTVSSALSSGAATTGSAQNRGLVTVGGSAAAVKRSSGTRAMPASVASVAPASSACISASE